MFNQSNFLGALQVRGTSNFSCGGGLLKILDQLLYYYQKLSEQVQIYIWDCCKSEGIFNEKTHVEGNR